MIAYYFFASQQFANRDIKIIYFRAALYANIYLKKLLVRKESAFKG
ncbi:hypothetical protein DB41_IB00030 [Neochlamydia sp. TUME1]|nr:hypothetical protein DB41_IB00030 [Neochlamydia sp. TUME1]